MRDRQSNSAKSLLFLALCLITVGVINPSANAGQSRLNGYEEKSPWSLSPSLFVYSESTYLSRSDNLVSQNQFRLSLLRFRENLLRSYIGFALEQDSQSNQYDIYNDNRVSPLVGLSSRPFGLPLVFFTEYRQNFRLLKRPENRNVTEGDYRLGIYLYQWWDLTKPLTTPSPFNENYVETVFSTQLSGNILSQAWSKLGLRTKLAKQISFDAYLELLLKRDRLGLTENNYQQVGPGARLGLRMGSLISLLSVRRGFAFAAEHSAANPEWNAQLVFTGEI